MQLTRIAKALVRDLEDLDFGEPVTHVYNPLDYAWRSHSAYLRRFGVAPREFVLLGMNPGPWGMAQTGVPFGEVAAVRDWIGIDERVDKPEHEHPKRPVEGFDCARSEVSGRRLWGWARTRFGSAERFFARFFVYNYCPLSFMEESGRNRTPDKLTSEERQPLFAACDRALVRVIDELQPRLLIAIGTFAEAQARRALGDRCEIGRMLHPSPASPLANRDWAGQAERDLAKLGVELD